MLHETVSVLLSADVYLFVPTIEKKLRLYYYICEKHKFLSIEKTDCLPKEFYIRDPKIM